MSDLPAVSKIEDALAAAIVARIAEAGSPIATWNVITEQSVDIAVDPQRWPSITIFTTAYRIEQADELNQSHWTATVEIEFISGSQAIGTISRANHTAIAHVHSAIAADRTLGGRLHELQEVDVAPAQPNGKDVGSASVQYDVQFFTPRDDWFTILGQGGETF
jgi:hypothetical protein